MLERRPLRAPERRKVLWPRAAESPRVRSAGPGRSAAHSLRGGERTRAASGAHLRLQDRGSNVRVDEVGGKRAHSAIKYAHERDALVAHLRTHHEAVLARQRARERCQWGGGRAVAGSQAPRITHLLRLPPAQLGGRVQNHLARPRGGGGAGSGPQPGDGGQRDRRRRAVAPSPRAATRECTAVPRTRVHGACVEASRARGPWKRAHSWRGESQSCGPQRAPARGRAAPHLPSVGGAEPANRARRRWVAAIPALAARGCGDGA